MKKVEWIGINANEKAQISECCWDSRAAIY